MPAHLAAGSLALASLRPRPVQADVSTALRWGARSPAGGSVLPVRLGWEEELGDAPHSGCTG